MKNKQCIICGSTLETLGQRKGYAYAECTLCDSIQLLNLPEPDMMIAAYKENYLSEGHYPGDCEYTIFGCRPFYMSILKILLSEDIAETRVLDYGCGWGGLCEIMHRYKMDYIGIDISNEEVISCQDRGLNVVQGAIEYFKEKDEFTCIIMCSVFEHLSEHDRYITKCSSLLKEGGALIILTPTSLLPGLFVKFFRVFYPEKGLPELRQILTPPWHTLIVSIKGMKRFLNVHGFELERIEPVPLSRSRGAWGTVKKALNVLICIGFYLFGYNWPFVFFHIFVCRKIKQGSPCGG